MVFEKDQSFGGRQNRDTIENNIDTTLVRLVQRGWMADHDPKLAGENKAKYDNEPPFDVNFSAKVTVTAQRELKVEGTWGRPARRLPHPHRPSRRGLPRREGGGDGLGLQHAG